MKFLKILIIIILLAGVSLGASYFIYPLVFHMPLPLLSAFKKSVFMEQKKAFEASNKTPDGLEPPKGPNEAALKFQKIMERTNQPLELKSLEGGDRQIISQVYSFDSYNKTAIIGIMESKNPAVSGSKTAKVSCPESATALFERTFMVYQESSFPVFSKMSIGDVLITYCMDDSCTEIGKECILLGNIK